VADDLEISAPGAKEWPIPPEFRHLFKRLPVLATEVRQDYLELLQSMACAIRPEDGVEWALLKTIVDNSWEMLRYERSKAGIIDGALKEALTNVLCSILEESTIKVSREQDARELAEDWFNDPATREEILKHLNDYQLDEDSIIAEAIRIRSRELEQIERMLASKEARRSFARREIDYNRERRRIQYLTENETAAKRLPFIAAEQEPILTARSRVGDELDTQVQSRGK
jgi:hypothetical protein